MRPNLQQESLCKSCTYKFELTGALESQKELRCSNRFINDHFKQVPEVVTKCTGYYQRSDRPNLQTMGQMAMILFEDKKTGKVGFVDHSAFVKQTKEDPLDNIVLPLGV